MRPTIRASPVRGKSSATSRSPSGSRFSTRLIARASARLSPATRRSASESVVFWLGFGHRRSGQSRVRAAVIRTLRFLAANRMLNLRYARLLWRYLWRRFLTPAGWRWETDGPVFFGKDLELQISQARQGALRALRLDRRRDQDPLPRGRGRDRAEDGDRPGVHDLGLPAGADRRAVRDRRPGDVHRLRPRHGRGRAPDPRPGHLHARRRGRLQRLDRLRRLLPARRAGRRQLGDRHELGRHQGRPRERGRRRGAGEGAPDARGARASCAGRIRSSPSCRCGAAARRDPATRRWPRETRAAPAGPPMPGGCRGRPPPSAPP